MKPTTKKFFVELNKKRSNKVNLSLSDDASQLNASLDNIRVAVGELFEEENLSLITKDKKLAKDVVGLYRTLSASMKKFKELLSTEGLDKIQ